MLRRGFLGAALAAFVPVPLSAVAFVEPSVLRLWGDGIHDDTEALQALYDKGGAIYLPRGTYLIRGTIRQ